MLISLVGNWRFVFKVVDGFITVMVYWGGSSLNDFHCSLIHLFSFHFSGWGRSDSRIKRSAQTSLSPGESPKVPKPTVSSNLISRSWVCPGLCLVTDTGLIHLKQKQTKGHSCKVTKPPQLSPLDSEEQWLC